MVNNVQMRLIYIYKKKEKIIVSSKKGKKGYKEKKVISSCHLCLGAPRGTTMLWLWLLMGVGRLAN